MNRNEIKVGRRAHYYSYNLNVESDKLIYVLHGYAQLAEHFLGEFSYLENRACQVVAPEGLSKFYGKERTPVSSWMTSHEREDEIQDQLDYLDALYLQLSSELKSKKLVVLAFSQGVSTAMRWINSSKYIQKADLLLCCGSIPPEIESSVALQNKVKSCHFFYGDQDRLMKAEQAEIAVKKLQALNLNPTFHEFQGRHEVSPSCHSWLKNFTQG